MEQTLLIKAKILLEKFPGKGGWTFVRLPGLSPDSKKHFGTRKVSGSIDQYELNNVSLMPMGKGQLFFPVNATIRNAIKKQEGDWVEIELYSSEPALVTTDDFMTCLKDEPEAFKKFSALSDERKEVFTEWILGAKTGEQGAERIAEAIDMILQNIPFRGNTNQKGPK